MRAHYEQKLKQEFVGVRIFVRDGIPEMAEAILATDLAELTGPVGENTGKAGVGQFGIVGVAAAVKAAADGPAAVDAVFGLGIQAESVLGLKEIRGRNLVSGTPEEFVAEKEGVIDGAAKRLPAESGVGAVEIGDEIIRVEEGAHAGIVVAAGVRNTEVEVGGFAEVAVGAQMAYDADVLAAGGLENVGGIAAENLRGTFKEPVLRSGQETRQREACVVDAILAANEIVGGQRPVDEGQGVIVDGVDISEIGEHLSNL